jgi:alpha-tubulin suppressor-like RCC1 family protein
VLLLASGQVLAFGSNTHGQLGRHFDSLWAAREDTPLRVPVPSNERVVQVACGDQHTVMLLSNGTALAFGSNALGQLGTGRDPLDTEAFAIVQFAMVQQGLDELQRRLNTCFSNASSPAAGTEPNNDAAAQRDQLLKLRPGIRPQPTRVLVPAEERVTAIACGAYHTALCCQSGRVYMCGRNSNGQLGLGHCNDTDTPQLVTALDPYHHDYSASSQLADAVSEADGADEAALPCGVRTRPGPVGTSIVLGEDGSVKCVESTHEARSAGGGGRGVVHAACGDAHTLFVCREGSVWACGCNARGQLGVRQALQVRERTGERARERAREGDVREREGEGGETGKSGRKRGRRRDGGRERESE